MLFQLMRYWSQPQLWETLSYPAIIDPPFLPHLSPAELTREPCKQPVLRGSSLQAGGWREGRQEGTNSSSLLPKLLCCKPTSKCRWYFLSHQLLLPHKGPWLLCSLSLANYLAHPLFLTRIVMFFGARTSLLAAANIFQPNCILLTCSVKSSLCMYRRAPSLPQNVCNLTIKQY